MGAVFSERISAQQRSRLFVAISIRNDSRRAPAPRNVIILLLLRSRRCDRPRSRSRTAPKCPSTAAAPLYSRRRAASRVAGTTGVV